MVALTPSHTSIILQTRTGRDIPNGQGEQISDFEKKQYDMVEKKYSFITPRTNPNPIYNCHGLTFASKRTWITDNESLHHVIKDDGYEELKVEDVLPGDIILYFSASGDIMHSAVVISEPDKHLKIPQVLSKWGKYEILR